MHLAGTVTDAAAAFESALFILLLLCVYVRVRDFFQNVGLRAFEIIICIEV